MNSKTLLLPPNSLPTGKLLRFVFRACYASNAEDRLCGQAEFAFSAAPSPLVRLSWGAAESL